MENEKNASLKTPVADILPAISVPSVSPEGTAGGGEASEKNMDSKKWY